MKTNHKVIYSDSKNMEAVPTESVDFMVTSPPYPMIAMWDEMFAQQSSSVMTAQEKELIINDPVNITKPDAGMFEVDYSNKPQPEFCKNWSDELKENKLDFISQNLRHAVTVKNSSQMELF